MHTHPTNTKRPPPILHAALLLEQKAESNLAVRDTSAPWTMPQHTAVLVSASGILLSPVPGLQVLKGGFLLASAWGGLRSRPEKGLPGLEDSGGQSEAQEAGLEVRGRAHIAAVLPGSPGPASTKPSLPGADPKAWWGGGPVPGGGLEGKVGLAPRPRQGRCGPV